jgi:hypothetical protein
MAIRPHLCDSWNITKQMKNEKIMQCSSIKSPHLLYIEFFLKDIIMHLLLNKYRKTHFENGILSKNFIFINDPKFN